MVKKKLAKSTEEFDRRFDDGEDIHELIDMSKARIVHHGKKIRITLDVAEELIKEIDGIRESIGVWGFDQSMVTRKSAAGKGC